MTEPAQHLPTVFEVFFTQEQKRFLAYAASRLRDRRDAEEAVLEAGHRMYEKWERILAHANPMALAYTILDGVVTDFYRRIARYGYREVSVAEPCDAGYLLELRTHEALDLAMETLQASAPIQASCVRMRHLLELSYDDIAERLGITVGAAKTNVCLGMQRLREIMTSPHTRGKGGM
jgi:DNA-directed RNA polymerase specialized sigma24 family protein